jgi:hypothetical protein
MLCQFWVPSVSTAYGTRAALALQLALQCIGAAMLCVAVASRQYVPLLLGFLFIGVGDVYATVAVLGARPVRQVRRVFWIVFILSFSQQQIILF